MAFYVSKPKRKPPDEYYTEGVSWCYMFADTYVELEYRAQMLGLKREWSQGTYYLLIGNMRTIAIDRGAIEIDNFMAARLRKKPLPHDPVEARLPKYR